MTVFLRLLTAAILGSLGLSSFAQGVSIHSGERLSDWLLRQPADPETFFPGLSWQVPAEQEAQARLKHRLLALLAVSGQGPPEARELLARVVRAAPVTGRVPLPSIDPRWLQAHSAKDPVLDAEQRLWVPRRPRSISVLGGDGRRCVVPHASGMESSEYLSACLPDSISTIDRVWIIQPDGLVSNPGVALWNSEKQDEPAPGALLWAPGRDMGWSSDFSVMLARFLATLDIEMLESLPWGRNVPAFRAAHSVISTRVAARDPSYTVNDWGMIGLLQTPTARMEAAGEARFSYSRIYPYHRSNLMVQPLDWLEAGFRYTDIINRSYGPTSLSGDQTFKDKSFDAKVRLMKETDRLPQVALGVIDVGGTGLFSSEYLVASKRFGNVDASLGLAWGYLGSSGPLRNPLSLISKRFDTREVANVGTGGTVNTGSFFHGRAGLFGGVQYHSPWSKWLFKAELDGNDYQHEPQGNNQPRRLPLNVGLVYRYSPALDFTLGLERGNALMLGMNFHTRLDKMATPKLSDEWMPEVIASRPAGQPLWSRAINDIVVLTSWMVREIWIQGRDLLVTIDDPYGAHWGERIDRIAAVLHRDAPKDIDRFVLLFRDHGITMTHRVILREQWVTQRIRLQPMTERFEAIAAAEEWAARQGQAVWSPLPQAFATGIHPMFQQNLGGPDGFLLYQLGLAAPMVWRFSDSTAVTGALNLGLLDNYHKFQYDAPSNLPRVRTSLRQYTTTSRVTMPYLQAMHVGKLSRNQFFSLYGGMLESMYGGIGAEWLYRPWHSHFAFGIDVNRVRQRGFRQDFSMRDYQVTTGHATVYWDTGWQNTQVKLSAGQYLAGDRGVTVDLGRSFSNGVTVGVWATKTNVSAAEFGEGSFDKGIYVNIPFDVMMTTLSPASANLNWSFLTRDGGARLNRNASLYGMTNSRSQRLTGYVAADDRSANRREKSPEERDLLGDFGESAWNLGHRLSRGGIAQALLAGSAITLAAATLDRPAARWVQTHRGGKWDTLGKSASGIPFFLAAGTGMLWWGLGGEMAAETSWTSIKSAATTLGVASVAKLAVGRARPEEGRGPGHFTPLRKGNIDSGFPSVHTGVAFALVTPFAQRFDAPWLYGVAGLTAFGRIQERKHHVSDTVAGALLGYAIGSLLQEQSQESRRGPQLSLSADGAVQAGWRF